VPLLLNPPWNECPLGFGRHITVTQEL
jgi:hypothetical protein